MAVELTGDAVSYADGDALIARRGAGTGTPVNVAPVGAAWGAAAREALKLLTGADRLPATAVRDLPVYREPIWGAGAPGPDDGKDGDTYIDGANNAIYGPKAAGVWPAPLSLSGDGGGIAEAPNDGGAYAREAGGWVEVGATLAALLTALDGKAAAAHTHAQADIGLSGYPASATDMPVSGPVSAALDGKAAVDHEHPVASAPEGRLLVSAALDEATFAAPSEVWPLLLPEVPVASFASGAILGSAPDGGIMTLTPAEAQARAAQVIDGGAAGLDVSGDVPLSWAPDIAGWRRRATGNVTLKTDLLAPIPEAAGILRLIFRQNASGGHALVVGAGITAIGDLDVSLGANAETVFELFAAGSAVFIRRVTPVVVSYWTHSLLIEEAAGLYGSGTGFGLLTPNTLAGTVVQYLYAAPSAPKIRMQLAGEVQPHTTISVEFEGGATYTFTTLPSGRYGIAGTEPAGDTLAAWIIARNNQTVNMRMIPT